MGEVYLDNAATTKLDDEVIFQITTVMKRFYGNPSSIHSFGRSSKELIENTRKLIAENLNVSASEIIFTSGGTEADNLILNSAVRDLGVKCIISSEIEHHAVLNTIKKLSEIKSIKVVNVQLDEKGGINLDHLNYLLETSKLKTLVSLMHVNNEIGNITDIEKIGKLCQKWNSLFHSDMVQSIGHFNLDFSKIPVDFTAASAHKFHGPKGIGFAYIKKDRNLQPLIFGGSQERGKRAGTESLQNIVGMGVALEKAEANLKSDQEYILSLKAYFITILEKNISGIKFNGYSRDLEKSTYTIVNICLPLSEEKALLLLFHLDLKGIACSSGSACQSGNDKNSHVLTAFLSDDELKKPSLRFSFSKYNTKEELDYVVRVLKNYIKEQ
ncbi:cysteine desulfurase [Antarcticibacterium flavum]|uniref:Cysteine desulfurase n=1 Tax=Antarcticibacterium flavum TaxID=2058175 RepID=A0A5B7X4I0_9FLAO|nr:MULTISPECIES: cysteine desulfurase family protein [Antarcticibacterium]MCM4160084.1 cysteine desulfurase [Antarcticibacterium sp. W02-3]QCY69641.1 cysteine desulfurase [Antarcticibacterium flavum]